MLSSKYLFLHHGIIRDIWALINRWHSHTYLQVSPKVHHNWQWPDRMLCYIAAMLVSLLCNIQCIQTVAGCSVQCGRVSVTVVTGTKLQHPAQASLSLPSILRPGGSHTRPPHPHHALTEAWQLTLAWQSLTIEANQEGHPHPHTLTVA